jgi:two-component system heavy metal sensor histidine kinase CusS
MADAPCVAPAGRTVAGDDAGNASRVHPGSRSVSLTLRIALYCALLTGVALGCIATLSYWELAHALRARAHTELLGERDMLLKTLSNVRNPAALAGDSDALPFKHPRLSLVVLPRGAGGPLVAVGDDATEIRSLDLTREWVGVREFGSERSLLAVVVESAELLDGTILRFALAIERTDDRELLAAHRWQLLLYCVAAMLLIGVLAGFVAQRAVAPMRSFSARVSGISVGALGRRLDVGGVPAELHELATSFNQLLDRLEDAFQRLDGFSADIAHELRTPIASLLAKTQVALTRARSNDEYCHVLESNAEELERMGRMVADMLFIARADDPAVAIERTTVDLGRVARELAEFHGLLAEEAGTRIDVCGDAMVQGDPELVRRAVGNLLANAVRHSPSGTAVVVRISHSARGATLEVENPGPGIAPAFQRVIFDRFTRGDESRGRARGGEGVGLGLAIVRSIMKLHGGTVSVTSAREGPTTFRLRFPGSVTGL